MGSILGLQTTTHLATNRGENARRMVHYEYPNANSPLTAFLSLLEDREALADYEFGWWEETWNSVQSTTAQVQSGGPFATDATAGTAASSPVTVTAGSTYYIKVTDYTIFRVRDVIQLMNIAFSSGSGTLTFHVTAINTSTSVLTCTALETGASTALNTTTNNGKYLIAIGTATGEGDYSLSNGRSTEPFKVTNYTQIFRTTLGPWTGSALKMGQRWDSDPKYKKDCKDGALRHFELMEKQFLWGVRRATTTTNADGITIPLRFAGGVAWYLKQWELGNTTNGGSFEYRPSGADITASDWTSEEQKRLITLSGAVTGDQMNELVRRSFTSQSSKAFEKLVFCGDKALSAFTNWAKAESYAIRQLDPDKEAYGMAIHRIDTPHGSWLLKVHPLFKENPVHQGRLMVLDLGDINYHPMEGRDSEVLANRQANNADHRLDEWLTEATIEVKHPRRHMMIDGLTSIIP